MDDVEWTENRRLVIRAINDLKVDLALIRLKLALRAYDPNQPRWPAGQSDGGEWRPADGALLRQPQPIRLAANGLYDPSRLAMCLAQQAQDEEICRAAGSVRCWESSRIRYNNCMKDVYIPPLEVGK